MTLPTSRNTTYAAGSQVKSADLNDIQDEIVALQTGGPATLGTLNAASATITGALAAASISTSGDIVAGDDLQATNDVIAGGDVSGATATISGALSAGSASITGEMAAGSLTGGSLTGGSLTGDSLVVDGAVAGSLLILTSHTISIDTSGASLIIRAGSGTPEGAIAAPIGSLYLRSDGGANTTLYVKESGTGNTGWVAK